jgi:hypothetical protein
LKHRGGSCSSFFLDLTRHVYHVIGAVQADQGWTLSQRADARRAAEVDASNPPG